MGCDDGGDVMMVRDAIMVTDGMMVRDAIYCVSLNVTNVITTNVHHRMIQLPMPGDIMTW
jgi:hypothetical protein